MKTDSMLWSCCRRDDCRIHVILLTARIEKLTNLLNPYHFVNALAICAFIEPIEQLFQASLWSTY